MKPIVPIIYYPLSILFVDDDVNLLKAYKSLSLPNHIDIENDPVKAVQRIKENHIQGISVFEDITDHNSSLKNNEEALLSFTFSNIRSLINNSEKYKNYGISVIDFKMPAMTGIELCENISEIDIIKIFLTAEYNSVNAIKALNNNTIDYFIQKWTFTTNTELVDCINILQLKYFIKFTLNLINVAGNKFNFLSDMDYASIFKNIVNSNSIIEYYLLNNTGCFLMIDINLEKYIFNCYSNLDLELFCNMYSDLPEDILYKIKKRELIPNFELPNSLENIREFFYPCICNSKYSYSFSKLTNQFFKGV